MPLDSAAWRQVGVLVLLASCRKAWTACVDHDLPLPFLLCGVVWRCVDTGVAWRS